MSDVVHRTQGDHALCNLYKPTGTMDPGAVTCPDCLRVLRAITMGEPL